MWYHYAVSPFIIYALKDAQGRYYFVGQSRTGLNRPRQLKTGPCSKALRTRIDAAGVFDIEVLKELDSEEGLQNALKSTKQALVGFGFDLVADCQPEGLREALRRKAIERGENQKARLCQAITSEPMATNKRLAEIIDLGERQVKNHLRELIAVGIIKSERTKEGRKLHMLE